jgi:hypothetical protein
MVEFVTGPSSGEYSSFIDQSKADTDPTIRWLCESQIINRGDYTNFRTLSISLIFALEIIIYAVNQSLDSITSIVWRKRGGRWRQRAWWAEGTLQLSDVLLTE